MIFACDVTYYYIFALYVEIELHLDTHLRFESGRTYCLHVCDILLDGMDGLVGTRDVPLFSRNRVGTRLGQ